MYTFLDGLDDRLDNNRSDVLQLQPFSSVEQAYAHARQEELRQAVMTNGDPNPVSDAVLASKSLTLGPTKFLFYWVLFWVLKKPYCH